MAAFHGLRDNAWVEIDGEEVPGMDGSSQEFSRLLLEAGFEEQGAERKYLEVKSPVYVDHGDQSIVIVPAQSFQVSYTLSYQDENLEDQYMTITVLPNFERELAPARTFCLKKKRSNFSRWGLGREPIR